MLCQKHLKFGVYRYPQKLRYSQLALVRLSYFLSSRPTMCGWCNYVSEREVSFKTTLNPKYSTRFMRFSSFKYAIYQHCFSYASKTLVNDYIPRISGGDCHKSFCSQLCLSLRF